MRRVAPRPISSTLALQERCVAASGWSSQSPRAWRDPPGVLDQRRVRPEPEQHPSVHLLVRLQVEQPVHVDGVDVAPGTLRRTGVDDAGAAGGEIDDLDGFEALAN